MAIAGRNFRRLKTRLEQAGRALFASLTVKLIALVWIFLALPFVLYGQFENTDRQTRALLTGGIQHRSWLIAQALSPILERTGGPPSTALNDALAKFTEDGTILRLMFRPSGVPTSDNFYFVASAPQILSQQLDAELDSLDQHGILKSLSDTCTWGAPVEYRYQQANGTEELLTSVIPIDAPAGCWVLISSHNSTEFLRTSIGRPYWTTDGVRTALLVYLALAVLAVLLVLSARRALRHFRDVAREIRRGGVGHATFASRNVIPELDSVAGDFDQIVQDLHKVAADIRYTTEDTAHALKTPLAIIRSALEPLKRIAADLDARSQRSIEIIDNAITRLVGMVSAAQRLGHDTADFIEAPKVRVNVTAAAENAILTARDFAAKREVTLVSRLDQEVYVWAPEGVLDVIVENVLDNALSFSKPGDAVTVTLSRDKDRANLLVEDQGPGIEPGKINLVFDRYFSQRPAQHAANTDDSGGGASHAGLGLWIVRRHADALGGGVTAVNRAGGGLCVHLTLPAIVS